MTTTETTCPTCGLPSVGKSKYCAAHRSAAHSAWKDMIQQKAAETAAKKAAFKELWDKALKAGADAAAACVPVPMIVTQHKNMMDDSSPVVKAYHVPSGVCGFAWVLITPATCSFVRWLAAQKIGGKSYYGGWEVSAGMVGGQSIEIKTAWAGAVAKVLQAGGIRAHMRNRED